MREVRKLYPGFCLIDDVKTRILFWFSSTIEPSAEGETAIFLHGQEKIWKGLVYMQSVARFVTKAYLVSGSFEHLKEVRAFTNY